MKSKIKSLPKSKLLKAVEKIINGKFITASPRRVDFFTHDLSTNSKSNKDAANFLSKEPCENLAGGLQMFNEGIVLITEDINFPIQFFCTFKSSLFEGKDAIQLQQIWCAEKSRGIRVDGLPLGAYSLFKILLPKFSIVIGADEHSPDGERFEKNQIKYAIEHGVFVYALDEEDKLYNVTTNKFIEKNENLLWGVSRQHTKRLIIYSEQDLMFK
jgi:hypothetical protein